MRIDTPWWKYIVIRGAEGEGDAGDAGDGDSGDDSGEGDSSDEESGQDDDESDESGDDEGKGGKKALLADLAKERRARQRLERQVAKLTKAQDETKGEKDKAEEASLDKVQEDLKKSNDRAARLALGYRTARVEAMVKDAARELGFADPEDAVTYLSRDSYKGIEIDQDEDDPSIVDVDETQLETALKALAKKKPHLVGKTADATPSGSKFGGQGGNKKKLDQEALKATYPALARRM